MCVCLSEITINSDSVLIIIFWLSHIDLAQNIVVLASGLDSILEEQWTRWGNEAQSVSGICCCLLDKIMASFTPMNLVESLTCVWIVVVLLNAEKVAKSEIFSGRLTDWGTSYILACHSVLCLSLLFSLYMISSGPSSVHTK